MSDPSEPQRTAAHWLSASQADPQRARTGPWLAVVLAIWAAAVLLAIPMGIGSSWRECDTQAIARNMVSEGFDPLRPRVDWRGDTDGAVECEFPFYQAMVAAVMAVVGEAEWPGRVISVLAMLFAAMSLHRLCAARAGPAGALAATMVFLTGGHAFLLGGRVTPDATSTALAIAGTAAFVEFLASGRTRTLWLATAAITLGCLTKATALQVGLLLFLWTLAAAPSRLREARPWLAFATILAVCAAWVWHGVQLHAETGLTFGVASGGETKFPTLRSLRNPDHWLSLFRTTMEYGFGPLGLIALAVVAVRRRLDRCDLGLLLVVALGLIGTFRYSFHHGVGPQYHVFAAVGGAWFVARVWPQQARWSLWALLAVAIVAQGSLHLAKERATRLSCLDSGFAEVGAAVAAISTPDELAVVRGHRERIDEYWRRRTNFEEPMMLYHARRRGWVLPRDDFAPAELAELHQRGARIVIDQMPAETSAPTSEWLASHADLVQERFGRRIYRLRASSE